MLDRAERTVTIGSEVGLHARPAARFVQAVVQTGILVEVGRPGGPAVDARSMISVMALGVQHGEPVVVAAEGDGADRAVEQLAQLLATDLDAG